MDTPALFILEPIGKDCSLEAVDVLRFCSESCRMIIESNTAHTVAKGFDNDWIDGTVCDECGEPLSGK